MYYLNKLVWFFLNPMMLAALGLATALGLRLMRKRRAAAALTAISFLFVWFMSTLEAVALLGLPLETPFLKYEKVETLPAADASVLLGGGIASVPTLAYPEALDGVDRVLHAARLYKAGKAPIVVLSGNGSSLSTEPLLLELGLSREALAIDDKSRNTYENSRFTERLLNERLGTNENHRILLVTSAWHMRRALGNFAKTSLSVTPAPCDFKAVFSVGPRGRCDLGGWLLPNAENLAFSSNFAKEYLGYFARR